MRINRVHFDVNDLCNAGCPQCARTDPDGCLPKSWLAQKAVSLEAFRGISPPALLQEAEFVYFCGNFGDPAVAPELIDIIVYCWRENPDHQRRRLASRKGAAFEANRRRSSGKIAERAALCGAQANRKRRHHEGRP